MLTADTILQNRYQIIRSIGEGGMGAVYLARDQRLGSRVALKETLFTDPDSRKAFEREAKLLANLSHPALPKVIDHFAEADGQFLVMEYIHGDDLGEILKRIERPLPVANVLGWADQLLDVVSYLHAQQPPIIHRDIKPQNLKVNERGQIILLDFGLAKGAHTEMSRGVATSIFGYTRSYAPLEQIQGAGTDARSDLYALAATLHHLLTGTPPPDALSRVTTVLNGQTDLLRPANDVNPNIPSSVAKVLTEAMALRPEERPAGARQMRATLHDATRTQTTILRPRAVVAPAAFVADLATEQVEHTHSRTSAPTSLTQPTREARDASMFTHLQAEITETEQVQQSPRSLITFGAVGLLLLALLVVGFIVTVNGFRERPRESLGDSGNRNSSSIGSAQSNSPAGSDSNGSSVRIDSPSPKELPSTNQGGVPESTEKKPALAVAKMIVAANPDIELVSVDDDKGLITVRDKKTGETVTVNLEDAQNGKIVFKKEGENTSQNASPPEQGSSRTSNDIGKTKGNGFYEITLENARKTQFAETYGDRGKLGELLRVGEVAQCPLEMGVSSQERAVIVRFTIRALNFSAPSIRNDTDFLIVDEQNRRSERTCGDARYFNVSDGGPDPKAMTITLLYLISRTSEHVTFSFQHVGSGGPITFEL